MTTAEIGTPHTLRQKFVTALIALVPLTDAQRLEAEVKMWARYGFVSVEEFPAECIAILNEVRNA